MPYRTRRSERLSVHPLDNRLRGQAPISHTYHETAAGLQHSIHPTPLCPWLSNRAPQLPQAGLLVAVTPPPYTPPQPSPDMPPGDT